jgi:hypothetical protein
VVGPEGVVSTPPTVAGNGYILVEQPAALQPGTVYNVFATPALLGGTADNLPATGPLFSFTTRQPNSIPGIAPQLVSVNDDNPLAFQDGTGFHPRLPFLDLTTLRFLFSEPLDDTTVTLGGTVIVSRVDPATGALTPVPGTLLVQGIHATFDPDSDLDPKFSYRLQPTTGILDLAGDHLVPVVLNLHPQSASDAGQLYDQVLAIAPPAPSSGQGGWSTSKLAGVDANSAQASSPLIGNATLGLLGGSLVAELADPSAFGGPIPFTVRKGQVLDMTNMDIQMDGQVETGHQSGTMHIQILTDATGYLTRNPYRLPTVLPDDTFSPVMADISFDAAMFSDDPLGNAMVTQNILALRLLGTAVVSNGALAIEQVGSMELDALGVTKAATNMVLSLQSSPTLVPGAAIAPLALVASYPSAGSDTFPVDGAILLTFSRPVNVEALQTSSGLTLKDAWGTAVPFRVEQVGADVRVIPSAYLSYGTSYTLNLGALVDYGGNPEIFSVGDATGGTGSFTFSTPGLATAPADLATTTPAGPVLLALFPGAPCALTGAASGFPGHCLGGASTDSSYQPFTINSDRTVLAAFNQPIVPESVTLGHSCGQGSFRVEQMNSGACQGAVPGRLVVTERAIAFTPGIPFIPGQTYQLTLVGGPDKTCDAGEICGALNHLPLNTHPLDGVAGAAGGPDVIIPFTATATDVGPENITTLYSMPFSDVNGNGWLDGPKESVMPFNSFGVKIKGTGGAIDNAHLNGIKCVPSDSSDVCSTLNTVLPIAIEGALQSCPVDLTGQATATGPPCVAVRIFAEQLQNTSLSLTAAAGLCPACVNINNETGMLLLRVREEDPAGAVGYIIDSDGLPYFVVNEHLYLDAPDLHLTGGITHDLHSKPLAMTLEGPVTFMPDGPMEVSLTNLNDVTFTTNLTLPLFSLGAGSIEMSIPATTLNLTLRGPPKQ